MNKDAEQFKREDMYSEDTAPSWLSPSSSSSISSILYQKQQRKRIDKTEQENSKQAKSLFSLPLFILVLVYSSSALFVV